MIKKAIGEVVGRVLQKAEQPPAGGRQHPKGRGQPTGRRARTPADTAERKRSVSEAEHRRRRRGLAQRSSSRKSRAIAQLFAAAAAGETERRTFCRRVRPAQVRP